MLETVFNDSKFTDLVEKARSSGYHTHLVQLFLDSPNDSLDRANRRRIFENGLAISKDTVLINFNENFKNFSHFYFYFDKVDLIFNGGKNEAINLMSFEGMQLTRYQRNDFSFVNKFAQYSFRNDRMEKAAFDIITANLDYSIETEKTRKQPDEGRRFKI